MMFHLGSEEAGLLPHLPPSALLLGGCFPKARGSCPGVGETQIEKLKANMWSESLWRARSFQKGVGHN